MSFSWSSTFTIGPATAHTKGDKIVLPPSALESIIDAHARAPRPPPPALDPDYDPTSWANPPPSHTDNQKQDLPSPLTFQVRNPSNRRLTHGGVKEFSAEEGQVQLPAWMMESLSIVEGDQVVIQYAPLLKGTWAKFRPLSSDFLEITDFRALLEAILRSHYTTLTRGEVLKIHQGQQEYDFVVEQLLPDPGDAVCITDTDLVVEFAPLETTFSQDGSSNINNGSSGSNSNGHLNGNSNGSKSPSTLRIGSNALGQVAEGSYQRWTIEVPNRAAGVMIQVDVQEPGDLDVLVSTKAPVGLDEHVWSNFESVGPRVITIPASDRDYATQQDSKTLHIGIYGRELLAGLSGSGSSSPAETTYRIQAHYYDGESASEETTGSTTANGSDADVPNKGADGYQECTNCGSWIPERTMMLHSNFCHRNNVKCDRCSQVMKKEDFADHFHCDHCDKHGHVSERKKHMEIYHGWYQCTCETFESPSLPELALHRRTTCPDRWIICRYCHTLVQQGGPASNHRDRIQGLGSHESYCGDRTIPCQKCSQLVSLKNVQVHAQHHEYQRQNQPTPLLCSNQNCVRLRPTSTASNILGMCAICFGPYWISTDDPKHQKLLQRLARRYHTQLMTGCGNTWCRNLHCATAQNRPMEANEAAAEMMTILKEARIGSSKGDQRFWLCVDEATSDKRMTAELLEQDTKGRFRVEWCIKALDTIKSKDMEAATQWLNLHAPRQLA
ncbi:ubiquitin fusion degradation protein UFD1-domain-containing protein [Mortierella sp. GBAus27b]|nr:hypothetical protein BGX31_009691 [Mortierella sp. GBA43]KAI8350105.1 ubiquitin fusion degradation protein UFD1-domain-containing protein [Mortierella sp. GBAus27b]